jgi:anaerobic selenocysteine-containing dehydrogenase
VAARKLYDRGDIVVRSGSLAALASDAVLYVNPTERDRIGVADGDHVRVTTTRGSVQVPLQADGGTPPGTAFLAFTQAGPGPADLIDASALVTDVRVEAAK